MFHNDSPERVRSQIKETDADIVMLKELTESALEVILPTGGSITIDYQVRKPSPPALVVSEPSPGIH